MLLSISSKQNSSDSDSQSSALPVTHTPFSYSSTASTSTCLVICQFWNLLKIWCTCLLEYFDLIHQAIAFKIGDNFLIKYDSNSCNSLCIFLCLILSFPNKRCCLSSQ